MLPFHGHDAPSRPSSQPQPQQHIVEALKAPIQKAIHAQCADVKPRLTKEQHDILETHFSAQSKPSTSTKKGFAAALGVPLDKINNWFQNRRAKVKQDFKKQMNQYNASMGLYGPAHVPQQNQQSPNAPQTMTINQMSAMPTGSSPTNLPVQTMETSPTPDVVPQATLQQQYDMQYSLRSIPEGDRTAMYHPDAVMQSIMAATAGASYLHGDLNTLPQQSGRFSYEPSAFPNGLPADYTYALASTQTPPVPGTHNAAGQDGQDLQGLDMSNFNYPIVTASDIDHPSTRSVSAEDSPFSGAQSTATTQSSNHPNASSVASITSMYSGWTEDAISAHDLKPDQDDFFHVAPYGMPQESASDLALPFWDPNAPGHLFAQSPFFQHNNSSAQAVLASSNHHGAQLGAGSEFGTPPIVGDDAFTRRNSSTSNLASNVEAIHLQNSTPDLLLSDSQPNTIAARRQKRPVSLHPSTMRSSSYSAGMPSPGGHHDHTLRRIRSSGIANAGRVQKSQPSSAQRSPMALTFADAAASPKFARAFSSASTATLGNAGNVAPPTPHTPNDTGRFPYWQNNNIVKSQPEHSSPDSLHNSWILDANGNTPPPVTISDAYRDTPPQSAPATQQTFPRNALMQPPQQMRAGFHSTSDLTLAQPKPSHFRRPSLQEPDNSMTSSHTNIPPSYQTHFSHLSYDALHDMPLTSVTHNVPFAPPVASMPDFLVHQYSPPQEGAASGGQAGLFRRVGAEPQQGKNYIFANQGPRDFVRNEG